MESTLGSRRRSVPPALIIHPLDPSLVLVPLTKGFFAVISAVDAAAVGEHLWYVKERRGHSRYAGRTGIELHRFIGALMGLKGPKIDHRDGNGLDCRRSNLREATHAQNAHNAKLSTKNTSGIKGVFWSGQRQAWQARVTVDRKAVHIGFFASKDDAAVAVRAAREVLHGPFANHGSS